MDYTDKIEGFKKFLKENLSTEKYLHSIGAMECAGKLAKMFDCDIQRAEVAALLHDCAKCMEDEKLLTSIKENKIEVSNDELFAKKTLHAPVGAFIAKSQFGITDEEILSAIRFHTIGKVGMTDLEKIIFIADKIEPKTREEALSEKVMHTLEDTNSLDAAMVVLSKRTIKHLLKNNALLTKNTVEFYNSLLKALS